MQACTAQAIGRRPPLHAPPTCLMAMDRLNHLSTIPANWRLWICTGELPAQGKRAGGREEYSKNLSKSVSIALLNKARCSGPAAQRRCTARTSQQQRPTQRTDGVKLVDGHGLGVEAVNNVLEALGLDVEEGEGGGAAGMDAVMDAVRWGCRDGCSRECGARVAAGRRAAGGCALNAGVLHCFAQQPTACRRCGLQSVTDTSHRLPDCPVRPAAHRSGVAHIGGASRNTWSGSPIHM